MKKIALMLFVSSIALMGAVEPKACAACHGANFEKAALGKSKIVSDLAHEEIATALKGYKDGTYGGAMKAVMKGQVAKYSNAELETFAQTIGK
ncbi:cytochrome C [Sulfurimonas hongkongensis]|uniref:Cytochrome C n=1 Tax=Sulfurimonas hongkongensis TaxID=1172190 RepID=T0JU59_9BACT|nr:cytochrome c [Sulfurimonas hongkongensis]EQB40617.1 cytochrome C [Sulfurimonas hongkongensis]